MCLKNLIRFASIVLTLALAGCAAKKIVARNCQAAGNAEVFVCDPL